MSTATIPSATSLAPTLYGVSRLVRTMKGADGQPDIQVVTTVGFREDNHKFWGTVTLEAPQGAEESLEHLKWVTGFRGEIVTQTSANDTQLLPSFQDWLDGKTEADYNSIGPALVRALDQLVENLEVRRNEASQADLGTSRPMVLQEMQLVYDTVHQHLCALQAGIRENVKSVTEDVADLTDNATHLGALESLELKTFTELTAYFREMCGAGLPADRAKAADAARAAFHESLKEESLVHRSLASFAAALLEGPDIGSIEVDDGSDGSGTEIGDGGGSLEDGSGTSAPETEAVPA